MHQQTIRDQERVWNDTLAGMAEMRQKHTEEVATLREYSSNLERQQNKLREGLPSPTATLTMSDRNVPGC